MDEVREHHVEIRADKAQSSSGGANLRKSISEVKKEKISDRCREVHLAVLKGHWEKVKYIYSRSRTEISYDSIITGRNETVLHIAVTVPTDDVRFVEEVVAKMSDEALNTLDDAGNTAFFVATIAGKIEFAKVMMEKKPDLAMMRGGEGELPLYMAASRAYTEMVRWLYSVAKSKLEYQDKIKIFVALISSNIYDVALQMLKEDSSLATGRGKNNESGLHALAQKTSLTTNLSDILPPDMEAEKITWRNFIRKYPLVRYKRYVHKKSYMRNKVFELVRCILNDSKNSDLINWSLISIAAQKGNVEFLTELIDFFPDLLSKVDDENQHYTIFHIAVMHRQEDIFRLIHEFYSIKEKITSYRDAHGCNMLHLAAKFPLTANRLNVVSGAALQLQRELLWFKEVEKVVPLMFRFEKENDLHKNPGDLFMESHKDLLKEAEKWMRGTADKCMLVATLVATVVFSAAFQLPGGEDNGIPTFLHSIFFKFFFMADAVSLVSSIAAVMIFLGIMTSKYQLDDFYVSLPRKLIIGLVMLFISLLSMLMAFVAATFLVFNQGNNLHKKDNHGNGLIWFAVLIAVIGAGPIILFIWMHSRLFMEAWIQTVNPESIFKPNVVPVPVQVTEREKFSPKKGDSKTVSWVVAIILCCLCPWIMMVLPAVLIPLLLWKVSKL